MTVDLLIPLSHYSWPWKLELFVSQLLFAAIGTVYAVVFLHFVYCILLDIGVFIQEAKREHEKIAGWLMIFGSIALISYFMHETHKLALGGYFGIYATWALDDSWLVWVPSYHSQ